MVRATIVLFHVITTETKRESNGKKNYDFEIVRLQVGVGVGGFTRAYFEDHKDNGRFIKRSRKSDALISTSKMCFSGTKICSVALRMASLSLASRLVPSLLSTNRMGCSRLAESISVCPISKFDTSRGLSSEKELRTRSMTTGFS